MTAIRKNMAVIALSILSSALHGCGGGGGDGGTPADTTAPRVTAVTPAPGASSVTPDSTLSVTFTEAMDCATLTAQAFRVTDARGRAIRGSIACTGATANFLPATPLEKDLRITARVGNGAADLAGNPLAGEYSWDFTIVGRAWSAVEYIDDPAGSDASYARVAADANGNLLAVWGALNGTGSDLWARRYQPSVGWGAPEQVGNGDGDVFSQQLVADTHGNAMVVWLQEGRSRTGVWASRYVNGEGWDSAVQIGADVGDASNLVLAGDRSGNAVALWTETVGTATDLWASRYTAGAGWDAPRQIEDGAGSVNSPAVSFDSTGNAVAVWSQLSESGIHDIWATRRTPGADWDTAQLVETGAGNAYQPQLAVDGHGNTYAAWHRSAGTVSELWLNRHSADSGWGTAERIAAAGAASAYHPRMACDDDGALHMLWNTGSDQVWYARHEPDSVWGTPEVIAEFNGDSSEFGILAAEGGAMMANFRQANDVSTDLWSRRYTPGRGWGAETFIAHVPTSVASAEIIVLPGGDAVAAWRELDGSRHRIAVSWSK